MVATHLKFTIMVITGNGSNGTGFLLHDSGNLFLVTAGHVLIGENGELRNEQITLEAPQLYGQSTYSGDAACININLKKAKVMRSKTADVIVVYLGEAGWNVQKQNYSLTLEEHVVRETNVGSSFTIVGKGAVETIANLTIGDDLLISGYPTSLSWENSGLPTNIPLFRKGIIATTYYRKNIIIIDCPAYPGNSGGPVLLKFTENRKTEYKVIGVISKFIPYVQRWENVRDRLRHEEYHNSGFTSVVAMDEVYDLIKSFPTREPNI
jgi:hypothetical protein